MTTGRTVERDLILVPEKMTGYEPNLRDTIVIAIANWFVTTFATKTYNVAARDVIGAGVRELRRLGKIQ